MVTAIIICVAGVLIGGLYKKALSANNEVKRLKEKNKSCQRALDDETTKNGVLQDRIRELSAIISSNEEKLKEYEHFISSGRRNLKIKEWSYPTCVDIPKNVVSVVAQDTRNPSLFLSIKDFPYVIGDTEDYEFAKRRAEELIETIRLI